MWKKLIAGALTATLLGVGSLAVAGAVGGHPSATTTPGSPSASEALAGRGRGAGLVRRAAQIAATTIGVSVTDLRDAIKNGQTVADVARAHNVEPQHVVDALVQAADTKIDAAVQAGKLTADRANALKQRAATGADGFVNHTQDVVAKLRHRAHTRRAARRAGVDTAASVIGISADELRSDLRAGQSIADVAAAHNVAVQTVVDALVQAATTKIDAAVQAGKLTADRAQRLEQRLPQLIDRVVHRHFGTGSSSSDSPAGPSARTTVDASLDALAA